MSLAVDKIRAFWRVQYKTSVWGRVIISMYLVYTGLIMFRMGPDYLGQSEEEIFFRSLKAASFFIVPCILLWLKEPLAWLSLAILHSWMIYKATLVLINKDFLRPPNYQRDNLLVGIWSLAVMIYSVICLVRIYRRTLNRIQV